FMIHAEAFSGKRISTSATLSVAKPDRWRSVARTSVRGQIVNSDTVDAGFAPGRGKPRGRSGCPLEALRQVREELRAPGAVHQTVVAGKGERQHRADRRLAVHHDHPLRDAADRQDAGL